MNSEKTFSRLEGIESGKIFPSVYVDTHWLQNLTPNRVHFDRSALKRTFNRIMSSQARNSLETGGKNRIPEVFLG